MSRNKQKTSNVVRIGTRGSPLALWQANEVSRLLTEAVPSIKVREVIIKTSGDKFSKAALSQKGVSASKKTALKYAGKGLFVKEIEEALVSKKVDIAVHSLKDVPAVLPKGLKLAAFLKRADSRDLFLSAKYKDLDSMPNGALVGTSSPRRQALVLMERPDLKVVGLRGNVETRIQKMNEGVCDATILAAAGLKRLNILKKYDLKISELKNFVSAIGQGVIAIEAREKDDELNFILRKFLNDKTTEIAANAERGFLSEIGGDCHTPIGAHAIIKNGKASLTGFVASLDGKKSIKKCLTGTDPAKIGRELGKMFVKIGARRIIGLVKNVLVTQIKPASAELIKKNGLEGANIFHLPFIEIKKPSDEYRSLDDAIKGIKDYDWLIFTSGNAVASFCSRMNFLKVKIEGGLKSKVAAVGPSTTALLKSNGIKVDLVPGKKYSSSALAEEFRKINLKNKRALFPRAREGLEILVKELKSMGANVNLVEAYETVPAAVDKNKWRNIFKAARPEIIFFSSPSAIRSYLNLFGTEFLSDDVEIRCIGKTTLAEAKMLLPSFQGLVFSRAQ
jgi:hydroxymethylbilane synthase